MRTYCDAIEARHAENLSTVEWIAWARGYAERIDPILTGCRGASSSWCELYRSSPHLVSPVCTRVTIPASYSEHRMRPRLAAMSEVEQRRKLFSCMLTSGARELRNALGLDDSVVRAQHLSAVSDARMAFMVATIDEVTKAAVTMMLVDSLLRERPPQHDDRDRDVRLIHEALFDELSLRRRKLTEALIACIAFRPMDSEAHYRCYLLLVDLDRHLTLLRDVETYYGCRPAWIETLVADLRAKIATHEQAHPEVETAWYRGHDLDRPGSILAAMPSRFKEALTAASAPEIVALGETYGQSYAEASAAMHFTPLAWLETPPTAELNIWHANCGLLGQRVLLALQDLTGAATEPTGAVAQLRRIDNSNVYPEQLLSRVTQGRAKVGDQVLADGYPGVVVEIRSTKYLRDAYRVQFTTSARPHGSLADDWFPAFWIETPASAATRTDDGSRPAPTSRARRLVERSPG
jgi:hypothetical protein